MPLQLCTSASTLPGLISGASALHMGMNPVRTDYQPLPTEPREATPHADRTRNSYVAPRGGPDEPPHLHALLLITETA
ncbi:uncharacterized protein B0I36DRAFT_333408 [Microdochium trichocladiopsis]|uniref:Uncharacterized protein n=1 Tax=Microdochium trichocladiopsis TaxID=1682393 RepID=A0A9P9BKS8_9PEZI|nr:uncharacterized protein B0I36DRAFT_333408 [Microdochium trichocladiopsis]KAH7020907.1 hypothetical protein B0I36DRAFT_333408 [Microdochium trichocladiopsis]